MLMCFCVHCPVCACVPKCMPSVLQGRKQGGEKPENDPGPIHMKQEGSYINIAPRPRGQAIYEANCSPVSHGGRTVYYAWGPVTCFKASPKTRWLVQWLWGVGFFYCYAVLCCAKICNRRRTDHPYTPKSCGVVCINMKGKIRLFGLRPVCLYATVSLCNDGQVETQMQAKTSCKVPFFVVH